MAYNCNGLSPLTDPAYNKKFEELPSEVEYFTTAGAIVYIDIKDSKGCTSELEKFLVFRQ